MFFVSEVAPVVLPHPLFHHWPTDPLRSSVHSRSWGRQSSLPMYQPRKVSCTRDLVHWKFLTTCLVFFIISVQGQRESWSGWNRSSCRLDWFPWIISGEFFRFEFFICFWFLFFLFFFLIDDAIIKLIEWLNDWLAAGDGNSFEYRLSDKIVRHFVKNKKLHLWTLRPLIIVNLFNVNFEIELLQVNAILKLMFYASFFNENHLNVHLY